MDNTNVIVDSGTTENRVPVRSKVTNVKTSNIPIAVKLPAGEVIKSTHTGLLQNENIPLGVRNMYLFPDLKHALVSIGLFYDNGCLALLDEK